MSAGLEWIEGYKPLSRCRAGPKTATLAIVGPGHRLGEALADYGSSPSSQRAAGDSPSMMWWWLHRGVGHPDAAAVQSR